MKYFDENNKLSFGLADLSAKIKSSLDKMGQKLVYSALLMWFAYKKSDTPIWAKNIVLGSLSYFISPIDGIPDLTPFFGFTDDLGVLSFGLVTISCYIDKDVREKAAIQLNWFFKEVNQDQIKKINQLL